MLATNSPEILWAWVGTIGSHGTANMRGGTNVDVYSVRELLSTSNSGKDLSRMWKVKA